VLKNPPEKNKIKLKIFAKTILYYLQELLYNRILRKRNFSSQKAKETPFGINKDTNSIDREYFISKIPKLNIFF